MTISPLPPDQLFNAHKNHIESLITDGVVAAMNFLLYETPFITRTITPMSLKDRLDISVGFNKTTLHNVNIMFETVIKRFKAVGWDVTYYPNRSEALFRNNMETK